MRAAVNWSPFVIRRRSLRAMVRDREALDRDLADTQRRHSPQVCFEHQFTRTAPRLSICAAAMRASRALNTLYPGSTTVRTLCANTGDHPSGRSAPLVISPCVIDFVFTKG